MHPSMLAATILRKVIDFESFEKFGDVSNDDSFVKLHMMEIMPILLHSLSAACVEL